MPDKWVKAKRVADLAAKRRSLELAHWEDWLGRGRGRLHLENIEPLAMLLDQGLKLMRLKERGIKNALDLRLREVFMASRRLPAAFEGLKILFISDLHIDGLAGLAERMARLVRGLKVDVCLLGGDYRFQVRGPCHGVYRGMATILAELSPPLGVIGILGNHDYEEEAKELERMGVVMLQNCTLPLMKDGETIWLTGLDDPHFYGCDDLDSAIGLTPDDAFRILLVHTPELFREAARAGVDFYLCGHTHAGQIRLPMLGAIMMNAACPRRYTRGLWNYGRMLGYTSSGAGSSMVPVRFNCPPELALITLRKGEPKRE